MKALIIALMVTMTAPAMAKNKYHNQYDNERKTAIKNGTYQPYNYGANPYSPYYQSNRVDNAGTYHYNSSRDQGSLSYTYDQNRYAPSRNGFAR